MQKYILHEFQCDIKNTYSTKILFALRKLMSDFFPEIISRKITGCSGLSEAIRMMMSQAQGLKRCCEVFNYSMTPDSVLLGVSA